MSSYLEPLASQGDIYYHRLTEAMKHAFAIRLSLGDPMFVNSTGPINALLSDKYMNSLRQSTNDFSVLPIEKYGGIYNVKYSSKTDHGTTHLSVIDKNGNAIALTTTINTYFGSKVVSPSTGILFNNQMDDFSVPNSVGNFFNLAPSPQNFPEPFKRPLSSMSPSIVLKENGDIRLIGGASGGPRIITSTVQVILNFIGRGKSLLESFQEPRIHSQLFPQEVELEHQHLISGLSIIAGSNIKKMLLSRNHNISESPQSMGVTQFISKNCYLYLISLIFNKGVNSDTNLIEAVSDPRKNGKPFGL